MQDNNEFEKRIAQLLKDSASPLPEDMLGKVLQKNDRKRRVGFFLYNLLLAGFLLVLGFLNISHYPKSEADNSPVLQISKHSKDNEPGLKDTVAVVVEDHADTLGNVHFVAPETEDQSDLSSLGNAGLTDKLVTMDEPGKESLATVGEGDSKKSTPEITDGNLSTHTVAESHHKDSMIQDGFALNSAADDSILQLKAIENLKDLVNAQKKDPKDSSKRPRPNSGFELQFSIGYMRESQEITNLYSDPLYYHKDFESVTKQAVQPLQGKTMGVGVKYYTDKHLQILSGLQYGFSTNQFNYSYRVAEIPVIDTGNTIVGYIKLADSMQFTQNWSQTSKSQLIAIPLQLGYSVFLSPHYAALFTAGITPQLRKDDVFYTPGKLDFTELRGVHLINAFSAPAFLGLGLFREEAGYNFGISTKYNPFQFGAKNQYDGLEVNRKRFELNLMFGFKI